MLVRKQDTDTESRGQETLECWSRNTALVTLEEQEEGKIVEGQAHDKNDREKGLCFRGGGQLSSWH